MHLGITSSVCLSDIPEAEAGRVGHECLRGEKSSKSHDKIVERELLFVRMTGILESLEPV